MLSQRKVWLNGRMIPWDQATAHIMSHSFSRGSAIFEVFGFHDTVAGPAIFRLDEHFKRLWRSAELLNMTLPQTKAELERAVMETIKINGLVQGFVKIVVFYGQMAFVILPPAQKLDVAVFAMDPVQDTGGVDLDLTQPVKACLCKWRKLHPDTVPTAAKAAANYLNAMLARQEAVARGFDLGFMLDVEGYLAEGSIESIFVVKDGRLKTPPLDRILASISRLSVLQAAEAAGLKAQERLMRPKELMEADEIFASATPYRVLPVGQMEDRLLADAPGPVSRQLAQLLDDICAGRDERFKKWLFPVV